MLDNAACAAAVFDKTLQKPIRQCLSKVKPSLFGSVVQGKRVFFDVFIKPWVVSVACLFKKKSNLHVKIAHKVSKQKDLH